jgi:hypothetical protein
LNTALNKSNDDNIKANKKLKEIEKFLLDYGLTWVGENETDNDNEDKNNREDKDSSVGCKDSENKEDKEEENSEISTKVPDIQPVTTVDFDVFKKGIEELNRMVCSEEATIQTDYGNNGTTRYVCIYLSIYLSN